MFSITYHLPSSLKNVHFSEKIPFSLMSAPAAKALPCPVTTAALVCHFRTGRFWEKPYGSHISAHEKSFFQRGLQRSIPIDLQINKNSGCSETEIDTNTCQHPKAINSANKEKDSPQFLQQKDASRFEVAHEGFNQCAFLRRQKNATNFQTLQPAQSFILRPNQPLASAQKALTSSRPREHSALSDDSRSTWEGFITQLDIAIHCCTLQGLVVALFFPTSEVGCDFLEKIETQ